MLLRTLYLSLVAVVLAISSVGAQTARVAAWNVAGFNAIPRRSRARQTHRRAALLDPASIKKLLDALGLPSKAPPIAPPRYEQLELDAA